jgi:signal transduction histidine kinase
MRSLFLKIFLWFWLAMALVSLAFFIVVVTTKPEQPGPLRHEFHNNLLTVHAQAAAEIFERDGQSALAGYLEHVEQKTHIRAFLFTDQGEEVSGHSAPPEVKQLAEGAKQNNRDESKSSEMGAILAKSAVTPLGRTYVLVAQMPRRGPGPEGFPRRGPGPPGLRPTTQVLGLIAVLLTGGVVCYGLARYLTAPVVKLRAATHHIAKGDLKARVGAAVGRRRDELADLGRDFDVMAERIESLVTAQRRLLTDISHELRSPLARLNVALGLARKRSGEEAKSSLDRIEREAERLNEMIGRLLTITSLESGAEKVENKKVDLAYLVHEIAEDADYEARSRNRAVRVVKSEECATAGDIELLRSAIENVVRNSVRYTAESTEVEISIDCRGNGNPYAVISVRDHGTGVPEGSLADIFRPFYRIADARDRQTGGAGLGLAITERAVQLHGGTVKAANAPDGGLIVEIQLPITAN